MKHGFANILVAVILVVTLAGLAGYILVNRAKAPAVVLHASTLVR